MTDYKKHYKQDDEGGVRESQYERVLRTHEHLYCLWNDHGVKCSKPAVFLTTTLATKTKQLPGGPHASALKGGYCSEHNRRLNERAAAADKATGGEDWRDQLVDAAMRARGL